jgi:hypothetical protein
MAQTRIDAMTMTCDRCILLESDTPAVGTWHSRHHQVLCPTCTDELDHLQFLDAQAWWTDQLRAVEDALRDVSSSHRRRQSWRYRGRE